MQLRNKKGFTLIELIMVIVIIGVLAAVAIPTFGNLIESAKAGATKGSLGAIRSAAAIQYAQNATTTNGAVFPATLDTTMFASGQIPENAITGSRLIVAVTTTPATFVNTNGWAYAGQSAGVAGRVWAFTNNTSVHDPTNW